MKLEVGMRVRIKSKEALRNQRKYIPDFIWSLKEIETIVDYAELYRGSVCNFQSRPSKNLFNYDYDLVIEEILPTPFYYYIIQRIKNVIKLFR